MTEEAKLFTTEQVGETLVITPTVSLGELVFAENKEAVAGLFKRLEDEKTTRVVLDLRHADYFGSSALGFFLKLWKRLCHAGGRLALCNVSAHGWEILELTSLDRLWPICASRRQALDEVAGRT